MSASYIYIYIYMIIYVYSNLFIHPVGRRFSVSKLPKLDQPMAREFGDQAFYIVWLVVEPTPLKNDGVRQLE